MQPTGWQRRLQDTVGQWRRAVGEPTNAHLSSMSLRGKVMLVVLATTCLALMLSAAALLIYELRAYRLARINDLQTQADIIGSATSPALAFNDRRAAAENLGMLRQRPQITAAALYGADHQLFATYVRPDRTSFEAPPRIDGSRTVVSGDMLEMVHPIRQNGETIGQLLLRADYDVFSRLADYLMILLGVMAASLTVAALVMARLQRTVTDPILQMAQVARDVMVRRDFSLRAPKTTADEVGELVDAFNDMLAEVALRTTALEQTNHHLSVEMAERQKAEEALRLAARKKDEFLATLAHELRTPLAPISNAVEILSRVGERDPALRQRALDIMARQLRQMVRLIDDLLDVSRVTTGKLLLHRERIDLVRVLHNAVETGLPLIDQRGHSLDIDLPAHPVYLTADGTRLAQVFANLLNNAAKYTPEGGRIRLALREEPDGLAVSVKDSGVGIPPEMVEAVFDLFVQVDQPLERGRAGLGVGLTLARQLVRMHGGRISVHSEGLGQGSEFIVWLPRSSEAAAAPALPLQPAQADARPLHILVADDNVDFATSLASILESLGHEVTLTHDGQAALEQARRIEPDLVFLDIGMPGLDGYEVATRLHDLPQMRDTQIVAVTGWGQPQDRSRSQACGMTHHLVKPAGLDQLLPILQAAQAVRPAPPQP